MTTIIKLHSRSYGYTAFKTSGDALIYAHEFEDGIVEVKPSPGMTIAYFAEIIEGCFSPYSNFEKVILKAFKDDAGTKVKGIKCVFNDVHICTATIWQHRAKWIVSKHHEHFE